MQDAGSDRLKIILVFGIEFYAPYLATGLGYFNGKMIPAFLQGQSFFTHRFLI
jgi:hypothetical protein